jgi:hypothetical protein
MMREKHPGSIYLTSSRCGAELFPLTRDIAVRNQQHTRPYSSAFLFTSQKSTVWTEIPLGHRCTSEGQTTREAIIASSGD